MSPSSTALVPVRTLIFVFIAGGLLAADSANASAHERPNIVIVLADDK